MKQVVVTTVSPEDCDFFVCLKPGALGSTEWCETGTCFMCGTDIVFVPPVPVKPKRICVPCAIAYSQEPN